jgi:hypothetical protein
MNILLDFLYIASTVFAIVRFGINYFVDTRLSTSTVRATLVGPFAATVHTYKY